MTEYEESNNAKKIVDHAKESVTGFFNAFGTVRKHRTAKGAPTNEEQDLVRSALVFAAAGLDSCIKHLIRDSIHSLSEFDTKVRDQLDKFVKKLIKAESPDRLAEALLADSPRQSIIDSYIYELTGSSLQSFEELAKAGGALGINTNFLNNDKSYIIEIFKTRNKIIHELDIKFEELPGQRERNSRTKKQLKSDARLLLSIADNFIKGVEEKIENRG